MLDGKLKTLTHSNLNKYLTHHQLDHLLRENKPQKLIAIQAHIAQSEAIRILPAIDAQDQESDESEESDPEQEPETERCVLFKKKIL